MPRLSHYVSEIRIVREGDCFPKWHSSSRVNCSNIVTKLEKLDTGNCGRISRFGLQSAKIMENTVPVLLPLCEQLALDRADSLSSSNWQYCILSVVKALNLGIQKWLNRE
jgi:hypothetical protein